MMGEVQYLVKWKGWEDESDRTWEPLDNLAGSNNLVEEFERKEAEARKEKSSKRKSDIKFVHENGDSMSEGEASPKKKSPRAGRKKKQSESDDENID